MERINLLAATSSALVRAPSSPGASARTARSASGVVGNDERLRRQAPPSSRRALASAAGSFRKPRSRSAREGSDLDDEDDDAGGEGDDE